ncbi:MAG: hypothetical protein ABSE92_00125 [Terriglobales bacterium]
MRIRTAPLLLAIRLKLFITVFFLSGCSSAPPAAAPAVTASRQYHGTASVGDFLSIRVDSDVQTITYNDISNNTSGTATYTVNADGTYTVNDPSGNLQGAYEVPNYMLLIQATKTGPNADAPSLVTAVESGPISLATFEGQAYNTMQFRTAAGGLEAGSISVNAQGAGAISSFWPYGSYSGNQGNQNNQGSGPFNTGTVDLSKAQEDSSGTFLKVPDPDGSGYDYAFGTANGVFAVDTQNGAILGLKKAASKAFDPSVAGTYKAIYYQKENASTGAGNVETGTPSLGNATLTVASNGQVTMMDRQGDQLAHGMLKAVADTSYLYGSAGELQDPCYGFFTFRVATANAQQDFFVSFQGRAMLFSSFTANLPWATTGTYDYFYGVGLK